jgi:hypothetical protein
MNAGREGHGEDKDHSTRGGPTHGPDFRSVNWFGTEYDFTELQAKAVKILWDASKNRTPTVAGVTILRAIDSNSERFPLLFRDHPAWGKMIVEGQTKGTFRLSAPIA